jgi:integrase
MSDEEIEKALRSFSYLRDKALFILGLRTGFRISELLSIKVSDVYRYGKIVERVTVKRKNMKKKIESRTVVLHEQVRSILLQLISESRLAASDYLFKSLTGTNKPISRIQAWRILTNVFELNCLEGKLGSHCMRKTFAKKSYELSNKDLVKTRELLGQKNINSTVSYLSFEQSEIDDIIRRMK